MMNYKIPNCRNKKHCKYPKLNVCASDRGVVLFTRSSPLESSYRTESGSVDVFDLKS